MIVLLALSALVHASHCLPTGFVDVVGFSISDEFEQYGGKDNCKDLEAIEYLGRGFQRPIKGFKLCAAYFKREIKEVADNGFDEDNKLNRIEYKTVVCLYYKTYLLDNLNVKSIEDQQDADVPDEVFLSVKPVVKKIDNDGVPHSITVFYNLTPRRVIRPCYSRDYERTAEDTFWKWKQRPEKAKKCEKYLGIEDPENSAHMSENGPENNIHSLKRKNSAEDILQKGIDVYKVVEGAWSLAANLYTSYRAVF